jgi:hypothetical protein
MFRYYTQTVGLFAPMKTFVNGKYYTSDYDLFTSNQYGLGFTYTDIFTRAKIFVLGLKSIDLRLNLYKK